MILTTILSTAVDLGVDYEPSDLSFALILSVFAFFLIGFVSFICWLYGRKYSGRIALVAAVLFLVSLCSGKILTDDHNEQLLDSLETHYSIDFADRSAAMEGVENSRTGFALRDAVFTPEGSDHKIVADLYFRIDKGHLKIVPLGDQNFSEFIASEISEE